MQPRGPCSLLAVLGAVLATADVLPNVAAVTAATPATGAEPLAHTGIAIKPQGAAEPQKQQQQQQPQLQKEQPQKQVRKLGQKDHHGGLKHRRLQAIIQLGTSRYRMHAGSLLRAGAGSTYGFKLHRRWQRVHMWSKPCRRLPLPRRAACERGVAMQVLHDKSWIPLPPAFRASKPSAFTVELQHD
mmetsp:Transcript_104941/g.208605  ORF Transcript_104941/g.208605 Transcript_104941/m.208605 type:complete len:186 (+) Transcript_104941:74-631(+)